MLKIDVNRLNSNKISYFKLIIDNSVSMKNYEDKMRQKLQEAVVQISELEESETIYISKVEFDGVSYEEYEGVLAKELDVTYYATNLRTPLFRTIFWVSNSFKEEINDLKVLHGVEVETSALIVFTDGGNTWCNYDDCEIKKIISDNLHQNGITTVYIYFGDDDNTGERIGFANVTSYENNGIGLDGCAKAIVSSIAKISSSRLKGQVITGIFDDPNTEEDDPFSE